jgi:16S rRNA processing protein RimM
VLLVVGRIGRAHGVRGEATVEIRTDNPDARFYIGAKLTTDPKEKGPLVIKDLKVHSGTLLLSFEGVEDRTAVERLRNVLLLAEVDPKDSNVSEDDFHISQIIDCKVIDENGKAWGVVVDVLQLPAQDTLVIKVDGREVLVPFVKAYVPKVDIDNKLLTIVNTAGLL